MEPAKPDRVVEARYVTPSRMFLLFADGFDGIWSFSKLKLNMAYMKLTTIKASPLKTFVEVTSKWGEKVELDSSALRALVDPAYAAEIETTLDAIAGRIRQ